MTHRKHSMIDQKLAEYEYLAHEYAKKVFNYERQGYTEEDIIQEMRIKIYMTILSFSERWKEYKQTGLRKPSPLVYWIRTTLANKVIDYIKLFNLERVENVDKVPIEECGFDIGVHSDSSLVIDPNKGICVLNGLDVLTGLKGDRRQCYCLWLYGYPVRELSKMFPKISVDNTIAMQNNYLKTRKATQLLDFKRQVMHVQHFEEA